MRLRASLPPLVVVTMIAAVAHADRPTSPARLVDGCRRDAQSSLCREVRRLCATKAVRDDVVPACKELGWYGDTVYREITNLCPIDPTHADCQNVKSLCESKRAASIGDDGEKICREMGWGEYAYTHLDGASDADDDGEGDDDGAGGVVGGVVGGEEAGGEGGAPAAPVAGGSGPNAHDINAKLGTIGAAESDPMAIFCSPEKFKWLCDFLGAGERQSMYGSIGRDGLWGACWSLRLVDKCLAACGASGGRCSAKSAWDACLEARDGGELACVQECQTSPYTQWCTVPDDVIQRLCLVAWPGPKPSECGGLGGVRPRPGGGTTGGTTGGASGGCAPEGSQCTCSITRQCFDGTEYTWKSCMADNCHIEVWAEDPCKCTGGDSCNPCN